MSDRIDREIELLKKYFPDIQISPDKLWVLIPDYPIPPNLGWNKESIPVALQFPNGFPGSSPYGIYVPSDVRINNELPDSYQQKANNIPPFAGEWGMLSWQIETGWFPTAEIESGSNMAMFVRSFVDRFKGGK